MSKNYKCDFCQIDFLKTGLLKEHLKNNLKCGEKMYKNGYTCHKCHSIFQYNWILQKHLNKKFDCVRGTICDKCHYDFQYPYLLDKHKNSKKYFKENFNIKDEKKEIFVLTNKDKKFKKGHTCHKCHSIFQYNWILQKHLNKKFDCVRGTICEKCHYDFQYPYLLDKHKNSKKYFKEDFHIKDDKKEIFVPTNENKEIFVPTNENKEIFVPTNENKEIFVPTNENKEIFVLTNEDKEISKKCACGYFPRFGFPGTYKAICCIQCKTDNMIALSILKKCPCGTSAMFAHPSENRPHCCSKCKTDDMVDIVHNKCQCGKTSTFGLIGNKPIYCGDCKLPDMVNLRRYACQCGKGASFNYLNQLPKFCVKCKEDGMINVLKNKCHNCADWIDFHYGSKMYNGYCGRCFQHLFPLHPVAQKFSIKTKEIAVRDYINNIFVGFQHDKPIYIGKCDCPHKRRIDHRRLINNTMLCIETDEKQHKSYDKYDEKNRYDDLFMAHSGKWIFIRFNPDKYNINDTIVKNPPISTRLNKLGTEINTHIQRILNDENKNLMEIYYLYFDYTQKDIVV